MKNTDKTPNLQPSKSDDISKNDIADPNEATILKLEASIGDRANTWNFDYTWNCPIPAGLTPIHEGLLQKGFGEFLRDASSTCKAKNAAGVDITPTPEHRNTAVLARLAKFKDGTYTFGGGGTRGPSLTVEQAAWLAYFKSKACKIKLANKKPTKDTLQDYQKVYVKQTIWPSISKALAKMDQDQQKEFHATKLGDVITKHTQNVIDKAESDEKALKPFIDAEKLKREGKKPEADEFHIDITIDL